MWICFRLPDMHLFHRMIVCRFDQVPDSVPSYMGCNPSDYDRFVYQFAGHEDVSTLYSLLEPRYLKMLFVVKIRDLIKVFIF